MVKENSDLRNHARQFHPFSALRVENSSRDSSYSKKPILLMPSVLSVITLTGL
jgi:hypothetical protein